MAFSSAVQGDTAYVTAGDVEGIELEVAVALLDAGAVKLGAEAMVRRGGAGEEGADFVEDASFPLVTEIGVALDGFADLIEVALPGEGPTEAVRQGRELQFAPGGGEVEGVDGGDLGVKGFDEKVADAGVGEEGGDGLVEIVLSGADEVGVVAVFGGEDVGEVGEELVDELLAGGGDDALQGFGEEGFAGFFFDAGESVGGGVLGGEFDGVF